MPTGPRSKKISPQLESSILEALSSVRKSLRSAHIQLSPPVSNAVPSVTSSVPLSSPSSASVPAYSSTTSSPSAAFPNLVTPSFPYPSNQAFDASIPVPTVRNPFYNESYTHPNPFVLFVTRELKALEERFLAHQHAFEERMIARQIALEERMIARQIALEDRIIALSSLEERMAARSDEHAKLVLSQFAISQLLLKSANLQIPESVSPSLSEVSSASSTSDEEVEILSLEPVTASSVNSAPSFTPTVKASSTSSAVPSVTHAPLASSTSSAPSVAITSITSIRPSVSAIKNLVPQSVQPAPQPCDSPTGDSPQTSSTGPASLVAVNRSALNVTQVSSDTSVAVSPFLSISSIRDNPSLLNSHPSSTTYTVVQLPSVDHKPIDQLIGPPPSTSSPTSSSALPSTSFENTSSSSSLPTDIPVPAVNGVFLSRNSPSSERYYIPIVLLRRSSPTPVEDLRDSDKFPCDRALFDTGAGVNLISFKFAKKLSSHFKVRFRYLPSAKRVGMANGTVVDIHRELVLSFAPYVDESKVSQTRCRTSFLICPNLHERIILGVQALSQFVSISKPTPKNPLDPSIYIISRKNLAYASVSTYASVANIRLLSSSSPCSKHTDPLLSSSTHKSYFREKINLLKRSRIRNANAF